MDGLLCGNLHAVSFSARRAGSAQPRAKSAATTPWVGGTHCPAARRAARDRPAPPGRRAYRPLPWAECSQPFGPGLPRSWANELTCTLTESTVSPGGGDTDVAER